MTDESFGEHPPELTAVFSAVADPERGRRLLPRLLGLLDGDDESYRLGACWAICHVLVANPEMASYLVRRLLDRMEDEVTLEVELLATYVWTRYPSVVDEAVQERVAARDDYRVPSLGGPSTSVGPRRREQRNRDVGRTRLAGEGTNPGPQQVYTDDEDQRTEAERMAAAEDDETDGQDGEGGETQADETDAEKEGPDPLAPDAQTQSYEPSELLSVITHESVFDSLSTVSGRSRTRYADIYRTLGVRDGDEVGVGLALFHRPSEHRRRFADELSGVLDQWHSVAGHEAVVTLYDYGSAPRPWAIVEYTDLTLDARGQLPPALAHWNALSLADALAHVHENGIVHGGIDPGNVAYYGNLLDDAERQPPMLTNTAVLGVVRQYFDPTSRLDPRYAAPENFDRRYGRIDHATDIYQLGAVCYRLFTGEPPFDGEYQSVRAAILDGEHPRPSEVADVPSGIDDVVAKATATEKLHRYESVTQLRAELRAMEVSRDDG